MLVAWSAILGVSMVGLVRRERRRRQAEEALQTANNELEMRVAERTRQLRQVNDQLASELEERKRADLELQKFVSLADNSSEFIGMFDLHLKPFYVNDAGMRLLGLNGLEQVRRTPIAEFFFPEDQPFVIEEFFPRVLQSGRAEAEIRFRHFQTGEPLWMIYNVFCIKDAVGQPVALATVSRNITERRQTQEELRTSEERLAAIVGTAMDAIITLDEGQQVVLFNAAAERIFGCPASEAIGKPLDRFVPERFRQVHRVHIDKFGTSGTTSRSMHTPRQLYAQRADGEEFPIEATISQARTGGRILYTVILRDITRRKQAEELEKLYQKTKDLDRLKTEFFANVSHELRTPLALILGPVKRRLSAGGLCGDERRDLEVIQRNARLLERHVNDLLDLSKLDAGRMTLDYAEVDLARLTRLVASYFEAVAAEREVKYAIEAPEALPAEVDPHKLERILINLLSNAFKFTPAGGSVRCTIRRSGDCATLEVEDSGPGIPPHSRETIFERFRQADNRVTRQFGGTGLGLSIVKEFVTLHEGCISVTEGRERMGSLFSVDLPLRAPTGSEVRRDTADLDLEGARQVVEELEARDTASEHTDSRPETDAPTVLVVEDNPDMNAFISRTLSPTYRTFQAFDGRAGLEAAVTLHPNLILCDVMMPRQSGDQMVKEVRRREELDDVPIVLLTAKADEELTVRMLNEGAQDYIRKPFDPEELMAKVGRLLADRRRAAEELQRTLQLSERLLGQKDELLQIVSHELRTPLTTIREGVSQVADGLLGPATPEQRKFLSLTLSGIDRLSRIINDLLDAAKIDAGRLDLALEHVDIVAIARQEVRIFEPKARAKSLSIRTVFGKPEIEVRADPDKIAQVFANLLGNALNFTERGEVVVSVEDLGARVSCAVRDTGGGIPPEALPKVFQKFYQAGRTPGPGGRGTGLGLPIAKAIVELHGGEITARSEPGEGTTFTFVLPKSVV
jgi:PAS domain S-box-containing protein